MNRRAILCVSWLFVVGVLVGGAAAAHRGGDLRLLTNGGGDFYDLLLRIFTGANGSYDGDWVEGNMHGRGVYTYANGDSYDGDWVDDKKHGRGVHTYADGGVYDGECVE